VGSLNNIGYSIEANWQRETYERCVWI